MLAFQLKEASDRAHGMNGSEIRASDVSGYVNLGQVWTLVCPVGVDERAATIHFGEVLDALEKVSSGLPTRMPG